ncbi:unnamed protein product, partial [Leptidea sinapis]
MLAARAAAIKYLKKKYPTVDEGLLLSQLIAYCSKEAHSCVEKAAMISFAMEQDVKSGFFPFFVSTTLGTTSCCSFDNLPEIGPVVKKFPSVWLHVDAAYAGSSFLCPENKHHLAGVEYADSFNTNPNKMMLTAFDCSLLWVTNKYLLTSALVVDPLYLQHIYDHKVIDYRHWGISLSRRFRSLKLWFMLRSFGISGLQKYIRLHCDLAKYFEQLVKKDKRFEVCNNVMLGLVCFRLLGGPEDPPQKVDELNKKLLTNINASGKIHMIPALLRDQFVIRFCVINQHATQEDMDAAWEVIGDYATELVEGPDKERELNDDRTLRSRAALAHKRSFFVRMVSDPKIYNPTINKSPPPQPQTPNSPPPVVLTPPGTLSDPGSSELALSTPKSWISWPLAFFFQSADHDTNDLPLRGKEMVDYICKYMNTLPSRRVTPAVEPGYLRECMPTHAPVHPEPWDDVMQDIEKKIMPGVTHWQHHGFHAYFPSGNAYPSILGDMLSGGIGCVGFSWGSASDCVFVVMLAARAAAIKYLKKKHPTTDDGLLLSKLVAYASKEAHSCVEKAAMMSFVKLRAMEQDVEAGFFPFFVSTTLGTTSCCSFDNLPEIGPVAKKFPSVWLHVDAAYAGSSFLCPENKHHLAGVEYADSFNTNPNKMMLTAFDCSLLWVTNKYLLTSALIVDPVYLQHMYDHKVIDYRHWSIPLSRRFRSLKLWFMLRSYGISGLQKYVRLHCELAKYFEKLVRKDKRFEVCNKVMLGLVCFRLLGGPEDLPPIVDELNQKLLTNINASGHIHMIPTLLRKQFVIRFSLASQHATREDMDWIRVPVMITGMVVDMEIHLLLCMASVVHPHLLHLSEDHNHLRLTKYAYIILCIWSFNVCILLWYYFGVWYYFYVSAIFILIMTNKCFYLQSFS